MANNKIRKVLIANRGEIAARIQRACESLNIPSLSIASEADKDSYFARTAQELVIIGPAPPAESYLAIDKIIAVAKEHGCDAIHPGYGFLAENAEFARSIEEAGLIFIGPTAESIEILGSKTAARERVTAKGVPCTPGAQGGLSDKELIKEAGRIGYPVLIKAVAGGGGRGMRVAENEDEVKEFLPRTRAEAEKNFASDDVYLEKYILNPRHVEVQVFGDNYGNVLHFGTRDCSAQRRHQKLIEEAPAPALSDALREQIHQAAVDAAKSVSYRNAGTAEFLVSGEQFYFLEMNTRIQVEHPVTEEITGVDLVALQLKVAMGEKIPFKQQDVKVSGHAMEFRIYAEDPAQNFMPAIGKVSSLERIEDPQLREDYSVEAGDEITPYYDAMVSKFIVIGNDRHSVIEKSDELLKKYKIEGIKTTIDFHRWLLGRNEFRLGQIDIGFVERVYTPDSLLELKARDMRDPMLISQGDGSEYVESLYIETGSEGEGCQVELLHRSDGIFVAIPKNTDGRPALPRHRRASNGKQSVLRAIKEVLDTVPRAEMFL